MIPVNGIGGLYTGYMRNGKIHGKGTIKLSNGDVCDGEWKDGEFKSQTCSLFWIIANLWINND